jgi:hypothetical protein
VSTSNTVNCGGHCSRQARVSMPAPAYRQSGIYIRGQSDDTARHKKHSRDNKLGDTWLSINPIICVTYCFSSVIGLY